LETGLLLVEGPQACREAALSGHVLDLYLTPDAVRRFPELTDAAQAHGGHAHEASPAYVQAISPDAQGVAAVARNPWAGLDIAAALVTGWVDAAQDLGPVEADAAAGTRGTSAASAPGQPGMARRDHSQPAAWEDQARRRAPLVAVFEQLRDPGNAGNAIRAADAAGADLVAFADQSADPTSPKVVRASAGSYFHLPTVSVAEIGQAVAALRDAGLSVFAADGRGERLLGGAELPIGGAALAGPVAWLFGNEARGLSDAARSASDVTVRIPIFGRAESINVATAAALCLYASAHHA
jgi:TrmH family RNA methyltransferase